MVSVFVSCGTESKSVDEEAVATEQSSETDRTAWVDPDRLSES
jgi:hypothetical protein